MAVARLIEHAARVADHAGKLTLLIDPRDLLAEADCWASEAGRATIRIGDDIQRALDERYAARRGCATARGEAFCRMSR